MSDYLTRAELLAALTGTHERTIAPRLFGGKKVLIRELTARQRLQANEAATAQNPDAPDNALYRAMLVQMSVVDPATGSPDDPRTRAPLLSVEDVQNLANGRDLAMDELITAITSLSALGPADLFRGHRSADGGERDAGAGAPTGADAAEGDADEGAGDADGGAGVAFDAGAIGGDVGAVE